MNEKDAAKEMADVTAAVAANEAKQKKEYKAPPISLLKKGGLSCIL